MRSILHSQSAMWATSCWLYVVAPSCQCCVWCTAAFVWGWRFQQFERSPKRQLFGVTVGIAKACGNVMKLVTWPLILIPVSRNLMTWLRCAAAL